jgi:hypothetical protein
MKTTDFIVENEFIGDDAHAMHKDHEVQMAREECYHAAKDAIDLHKLLKGISEIDGLEGWVSEKIALAADYLKTVREYLEYDQLSQQQEAMPEFAMESAARQLNSLLAEGEKDTSKMNKQSQDFYNKNPNFKRDDRETKSVGNNRLATRVSPAGGAPKVAKKPMTPFESMDSENNAVAGAITRRILLQRTDLLSKYGPVLVMQAIDEVADFVGDAEEIGSSDVSGWIKQVEQVLASTPPEAVGEDDGKQPAPDSSMAQYMKKRAELANRKKPSSQAEEGMMQEDATGGATGAASMGAVVSQLGAGSKPHTGKPAKIGNIIKRPKINVGRGVY